MAPEPTPTARPNSVPAGLFGLARSNRDFEDKDAWGKNQFNSSFPASLACYMHTKGVQPICLSANASAEVVQSELSVEDLFGIDPGSANAFFSFETPFSPYADLVVGHLPRVDLVVIDNASPSKANLSGLEVKLTAIPDSTTSNAAEDCYGCELVVRPDTIVYLALAICARMRTRREEIATALAPLWSKIPDWNDAAKVGPLIPEVVQVVWKLVSADTGHQRSLLIQPIWKTVGKTTLLAPQCFDMFVWTDLALLLLAFDSCRTAASTKAISRHERTAVWILAMLHEFAVKGQVNHERVIDDITLNNKNDKAFASAGAKTLPYMRSAALTNPRMSKSIVGHLILGHGERFLSPERRLDAAILGTPGLFDSGGGV
jgi:hypothetical protein